MEKKIYVKAISEVIMFGSVENVIATEDDFCGGPHASGSAYDSTRTPFGDASGC